MNEGRPSLFLGQSFQDWSKVRTQRIKDVVVWELDKLCQELHEHVIMEPPAMTGFLVGPASRQMQVPGIDEIGNDAPVPQFDEEGQTGKPKKLSTSSTAGPVRRNSGRKKTPHAGTLCLENVDSETGSEASPGMRREDVAGETPDRRKQGSVGSKWSQATEALDPVQSQSPSEITAEHHVALDAVNVEEETGPTTLPALATCKTKMLHSQRQVPTTRLSRLVTGQFFDIFYSLCIIINCLTMGLQADMLVVEYSEFLVTAVDIVENILVFLFTLEILARLKVYGKSYFSCTKMEGWMNAFDAIIVVLSGVIFSWVLPLLAVLTGEDFSAGWLRTLSVFRALRLLRIVRVIQQMPMFREVWLLLRGLTSSLRTLVWTVTVIFVLTYVFAILGCWLISNEINEIYTLTSSTTDEADLAQLEATFKIVRGIGPLMQLLIQFLTLDSWNQKMEQLMVYTPWCLVYFYMYIAVAVFVLMNLVTAIIVENAMSASRMDENQRLKQMEDVKKKELKELEQLFYLMDSDGDGTLDWEEFESAFLDEEMSRKWRLLEFQPDECKELFDLLDDGDGGIETKEFFHGLARMKGGAQSRDLMRVTQKVDRIGKDLQQIHSSMQMASMQFMDSRSNASGTSSVLDDRGPRTRQRSDENREIGKKKGRKSVLSPKVSLEEAKKELQLKMAKEERENFGSEASSGARSFF